ncbi:MAG: tetratricopeptide repeat protein [Desulfovibrionales bacterium]|nr:tetratricopeptide repeat protein [Desulfovibrionales bacterium]
MEERTSQMDILKTIEQEMDADIHPVLKKILDNIKPIGLALAFIVASVAVYTGFTSYQNSQRARAVSELGGIMIMTDTTSRTAKLEAFAQSGSPDLRAAAQLELAKVYMDAKEFDKAAATWRSLAQASGLKTMARLGEAKALMMKGEHAKAVELLTKLKSEAGQELNPGISSALAFAAEKAGQEELAIAEYTALKAAAKGDDPFLDYKIDLLRSKIRG